jgi:hypothetical protein
MVTWLRFVAIAPPRTDTFVTFVQSVIEHGGAIPGAAVFMDPGSSPG